MNKSHKPSIFKTSLLAILLTSAFSAQGASLGKLSAYSSIGQQLNAEVALSATPVELGSMTAKLASMEAFREAGIEYMSLLSDVRILLDKDAAGQPILRLSSARPINEPFLHFLVELSWTSGRMVREYTVLLDPPELLQQAKPASVVAPAVPALKVLPPVADTVRPKPESSSPGQADAGGNKYQVKQGDTLAKIARETRSDPVTLDQMLVALFNGNRDAFTGNNMNRLRAGKILRVPSAEETRQVDPGEARKLIIKHAGEFNAYRNRLAGVVSESTAAQEAPRQQVSGTIRPQVEDKISAPAAKDKLEVSRTEPEKAAKASIGSSIEEDLIARDKALREASERIALLEKNIENLKQLVEIKSQAGAKLQQQGEASQTKPVEAAKPAPPPVPATPPASTEPATAVEAAKPPPAKATPIEAKKPVAPPPPPPPEPSFIDENPEIVYGGGGLIALLLGYLGFNSWRRRKAQADDSDISAIAPAMATVPDEQESIVPPIHVKPASAQDVGEISIQGDFSEGALLTNGEIVDPVAEADVLMAYGRDRQAEEILQEGLNKDPSRQAIHMKLLELYAKQENLAQFETIATRLHDLNNGRGAEWEKVRTAAHALGLSGGIFASSFAAQGVIEALAESAESSKVVEPDVDESVPVALPEEVEANETALVEEAPSLEFDLDLGTTTADRAATEPVEEVAHAADDDREAIFDAVGIEQVTPEGVDVAPVKPEEPVEASLSELEFDLDLGTTAGSPVTEENRSAASEPPKEDDGLDFDFDLGTPEEKEAVEAAVASAEHEDKAPGVDLTELDFDLDLGSSVEPETAEAPKLDAVEATEEFDAPAESEVAESELPIAGGLGDLKLDFDLELDTDQEPVEATVPALAESLPAVPEADGLSAMAQNEPEVQDTPPKPDNPEVDTKLELAQAYEEMGDLEGARELLNEVLNEGSEKQQVQARAKLEQLSI